jgi:hypothetical protein
MCGSAGANELSAITASGSPGAALVGRLPSDTRLHAVLLDLASRSGTIAEQLGLERPYSERSNPNVVRRVCGGLLALIRVGGWLA